MYKFLLSVVYVVSLSAEMVGGVAVVVQDKSITLYDLEESMKSLKVDEETAKDILIRQKLEEIEIDKRKLDVSTTEVYDDIRATAQRNGMDLNAFYDAVLTSNGLNSAQLKKQVKKKLLTQKLYSSISFSELIPPNDEEMKEYYELHKDQFAAPASFSVLVYETTNQEALAQKLQNPMFYSPQITSSERIIKHNEASPQLISLLNATELNTFTQIVPGGDGRFMSFYLKEKSAAGEAVFDDIKDEITNVIMGNKRELVLQDYFTKLKDKTQIEFLRSLN